MTESQQQEVRESLSQIGLSHAEQETYLLLLKLGTTTASPVAHNLKIPLTTAQSLLKRLAVKGVIHVMKRGSRSSYEAKDPLIFKTLLQQQLDEIVNIVPLLRSLRTDQPATARMRVYPPERASDIFRQALVNKEKVVYEIVSAKELQESLGEKFHFTRRRVAAGIDLKSLRVEAGEIKRYSQAIHARERREAKFLPKDLSFRCSILFWDDCVAYLTPHREGVAWIIRSAAMREMWQQLFDLLWSVSRRMETSKEE